MPSKPRKPKKSKPGRPPTPASEKHTPVNTTVSPAVRAYLERVGDKSASRGARRVLTDAAKNNREIPPE